MSTRKNWTASYVPYAGSVAINTGMRFNTLKGRCVNWLHFAIQV